MRPVSDEAMDAARAATEEKIRAYELREARKACGLTQEQVSERMGVGQKRVSAVETGKIDTLKVDTLRRYVAALGGGRSASRRSSRRGQCAFRSD